MLKQSTDASVESLPLVGFPPTPDDSRRASQPMEKHMKSFLIAAAALTCSMAGSDCLAGNLRAMSVVEVRSAQGPVEAIGRDPRSTRHDHGGGWIIVTTDEFFALDHRRATLNGLPMEEMRAAPLCGTEREVWECPAGARPIGHRRVWWIQGVEGGTFEYSARQPGLRLNAVTRLTIR